MDWDWPGPIEPALAIGGAGKCTANPEAADTGDAPANGARAPRQTNSDPTTAVKRAAFMLSPQVMKRREAID
jgi:hypothetical protein